MYHEVDTHTNKMHHPDRSRSRNLYNKKKLAQESVIGVHVSCARRPQEQVSCTTFLECARH